MEVLNPLREDVCLYLQPYTKISGPPVGRGCCFDQLGFDDVVSLEKYVAMVLIPMDVLVIIFIVLHLYNKKNKTAI